MPARSHSHFLGNRWAPESPWGETVLPGKNGCAAGIQVRVRERFPYPNGVRIVVIPGVRVATDRSCSVRETEERDLELSADTR